MFVVWSGVLIHQPSWALGEQKKQCSTFDLPKKQEVYKLIVLRSMMTGEEAKAQASSKLLTDKEASDILASYHK